MNTVLSYDVIVAGAGPVGLLLAGELAGSGVHVLVLERGPDAVVPIKEGEMGARSLNAPSVHALHLRRLLPRVREAALFWWDPEVAAEPGTFAGHFAGIGLRPELFDADDPDLATAQLGAGVISQGAFERVLLGWAREQGAEIRFDAPVSTFSQHADGVTVEAGGSPLRAGWLVGCDGGRSAVRKAAGIEFAGVDAESVFLHCLVDLAEPELLLPGGLHETPTGSYLLGGWERRLRPTRLALIEPGALGVDRDEPVTAQEIEAAIKRIAGVGTTVTAVHAASRHSDVTRQAVTYRSGRVLLAGDAAHVHSTAGGQGLNLGIGDAMNLGWKLAAEITGRAPAGLLDTYQQERHPIGAWVQDWTKAQAALGRRDPRTLALHAVVEDLLQSTHAATYVIKKISGVAQHYALSPDHPLIGRPAPFAAIDGARPGRFVLVVDRASAVVPPGIDVQVGATATAMLVRPDGYVAWAADLPLDSDALRAVWAGWVKTTSSLAAPSGGS